MFLLRAIYPVVQKFHRRFLYLNHERKVPCHRGRDPERQRHDGEGDGAAALGGHAGDRGAEDHRDGEDVALGEEGEVVPADGEQPPAHFEENQGDEDPYLKMQHRVTLVSRKTSRNLGQTLLDMFINPPWFIQYSAKTAKRLRDLAF